MNPIQQITSRQSKTVVETAKLKEKKHRDLSGEFVFEGKKLLEEALEKGVVLNRVFVTEAGLSKYGGYLERLPQETQLISVSDEVYAKLSMENSPQGVFCVAKRLDKFINFHTIYNNTAGKAERILACECLQDPGNLGTIIRCANAFGFERLVLSADCADVYSPKVIRASMGGIFCRRIDIADDFAGYLTSLRQAGRILCAAALTPTAQKLTQYHHLSDAVFVIGNEGKGLSDLVSSICGESVMIPMEAGAESLNASMAATILMWEQYRVGQA